MLTRREVHGAKRPPASLRGTALPSTHKNLEPLSARVVQTGAQREADAPVAILNLAQCLLTQPFKTERRDPKGSPNFPPHLLPKLPGRFLFILFEQLSTIQTLSSFISPFHFHLPRPAPPRVMRVMCFIPHLCIPGH